MGRWQKDRENAEGDSLSGSGQGTKLNSVKVVTKRKMLCKLFSIMNNPSHPVQQPAIHPHIQQYSKSTFTFRHFSVPLRHEKILSTHYVCKSACIFIVLNTYNTYTVNNTVGIKKKINFNSLNLKNQIYTTLTPGGQSS